MKITGQILKENRERKGISVNEVAIATKINTKTILALEDGDLNRLPPKTFLRGFVRSYASFLELDVESVLNTFQEEMGSTKPKPEPEEAVAKSRASGEADDAINPKASLSMKIGAVTGILLLVVLIVFFKNKMESYEKETIVEGVPPGIESLNTNAPPSPVPSPTVEVASSPSPTEESTPAPTVTATPSSSAIAPIPVTPVATSTPAADPTSTPRPSPKTTPTAPPTPKPSPTASPTPAAKPQDVIVEALNPVDIDAQIDGENRKFKLNAEQVQQIKAKRKIVLKISDGGAVSITVNGQDRGVPGDLGKPVRVEYP